VETTLLDLPEDLLSTIWATLGVAESARLATLCKAFHKLDLKQKWQPLQYLYSTYCLCEFRPQPKTMLIREWQLASPNIGGPMERASIQDVEALLGEDCSVSVKKLVVEDLDNFNADARTVKLLKSVGVSELLFDCLVLYSSAHGSYCEQAMDSALTATITFANKLRFIKNVRCHLHSDDTEGEMPDQDLDKDLRKDGYGSYHGVLSTRKPTAREPDSD
jgi:hypothetical protein